MAQLNYVAHLIIESFKENGLDNSCYLADKQDQFIHHSKLDSLLYAVNQLDGRNTKTFCNKLGVTVDELHAAMRVLNKI